jgi:hypothetical protein
MVKIRHNLNDFQDRLKICAYKGKTHKEFKVGDHVFLKVKSICDSLKLGNCSKLVARYCGPFEIIERICPIAYILAFPTSLCMNKFFNVSLLKKYVPNANNIIYWNVIQVEAEGNFQV